GMRVIVAGLDMDFRGNPFGPMPALMATAEYVTKVHAICTRTGQLANYSFRNRFLQSHAQRTHRPTGCCRGTIVGKTNS
ncbi:MAG: hypothetical protein RLZZ463_1232, partial [Bacteroidota bacterium]